MGADKLGVIDFIILSNSLWGTLRVTTATESDLAQDARQS